MDMNNVNIEEIVKQVLSGMTGKGAAPAASAPAAPAANGGIPKTARVAMTVSYTQLDVYKRQSGILQ